MTASSDSPTRRRWIFGLAGAFIVVLLVVFLNNRQQLPSTILVVDPAGRPVPGVPIELQWRTLGQTMNYDILKSDSEGVVSLDQSRSKYGGMFSTAWILPDVPGVAGDYVKASTVSRLEVPDLGKIEVRVVDSHGEPYRSPSLTSLHVYLEWDLFHDGPSVRTGQHLKYWDSQGSAMFDPVAVDREVRITAHLQGVTLNLTTNGPQTAGALLKLQMQIPADVSYVTGTCVDANAAPIQGEIGFKMNGPGQFSAWKVTTNAEGRFRFLIRRQRVRAGTVTLFHSGQKVKVKFTTDGETEKIELGEFRFSKK